MASLYRNTKKGRHGRREPCSHSAGIALIVVLGFLTILILMTVALLTLTRTERMVSAYTSEGVRAKQLALGAIDRAMDDLNNYFKSHRFVRLSPADAVFISLGTGGKVGSNTGMFRGEHTNWLPGLYWDGPPLHYNLSNIWEHDVEWIVVRDPTNMNLGTLLGRFAYVIADCTGLLDANTLGVNTISSGVYEPKSIHTSTRDIGLERVPEAEGNAADLNRNRTNYHAFLTFQEVARFNDGKAPGNWPAGMESSVFLPGGIRTVAPFSLSYDKGKWWDPSDWGWQVGMFGAPPNVNDWSETQAFNVFQNLLGVTADIATQIAEALMDYKDADRIPRNTRSLTVEAVPMLNEFIFSGSVSFDGVNVILEVRITPETWYPFPTRTPDTGYRFQDGRPTIASTPGVGDITMVVRRGNNIIDYGLVAPNSSAVIGAINYNNGNPQAWPPLVYRIPLPGVTNNDTLRIGTRLELAQLYNGQNLIVDEAVGPFNIGTPFSVTVPETGSSPFPTASREVNDPRLNHVPLNWSAASAGTPGAINNAAFGAGLAVEGASMFVRDGNLESVAELGFISVGTPWQTIPLYTPAGAALLNRFRSYDPLGKPPIWTNGLVNPNTHFPDVFGAVFYGVDLAEVPRTEEVPNFPTNAWNNAGQIDALQDSLMNWLNTTQFFGAADWVAAPAMQSGGALAVAGLNNNQREAIIRNSYQTFSVNGNLYTIFVLAQTFGFGNTNEITAERRLAALVWHDPFPSEEKPSRHRWFIRWFNWLE